MRVIAGSARRLLLKAPDGMDTRPTADRVKESLFNMLNPDLYGCAFLDLFSGSGAIGIEALSRGAQRAVLVDASMECAGIIKQNLEVTKLGENAEIINEDVYAAIERLGRRGDKFDIIFMDPPYAAGYYVPVMEAIKKADILAAEGYIVAESAKGVDFTAAEGFKIFKERKCGPAVMNFLNLEEEKC
ncbi:MAG TPA: 16S rRNA (guanine(966)-N(2))-methyltransferase RsmD [Firmicutes bacterium]|nr:16S rRNA (guanine(966)-N(2))-methyltransferase RsmD [Bacillota bacterium]